MEINNGKHQSFLTGSRVYGTPRPDSDYDMVVLLKHEELAKMLEAYSAACPEDSLSKQQYDDSVSLHFANLNLIVITDPDIFNAWLQAKHDLEQIAPVTHEVAEGVHKIHIVRCKNMAAGL